jgi:hypothetical protein
MDMEQVKRQLGARKIIHEEASVREEQKKNHAHRKTQ